MYLYKVNRDTKITKRIIYRKTRTENTATDFEQTYTVGNKDTRERLHSMDCHRGTLV